MRNVGIVRRLDALGRIVIPREYRKMHRIELGDPLEIVAMDNGEIILKKVDLNAELLNFGQMICSAASREAGKTVLVCSVKSWITGSGSGKSNFINTELPTNLSKLILDRREYNGKTSDIGLSDNDFEYVVAQPIIGDMDCFGAVAIFSHNKIEQSEACLAKTLAAIAGNNLQKY